MVNEISIGNEWIDAGEWVRKDVSKVTEQDVKGAQWDSAQAKKAQEEIKKSKAVNNNIAKFLEFLLRTIKNEDLISCLYNTFFKVVDTKTGTEYLRKAINDIIIVGFFAPFFKGEIEKFWLWPYFNDFLNTKKDTPSISEYIEYIKSLSKKYHDNIPINKSNLLKLISLIAGEFGIIKDALSDNWQERIKKELSKK